MMPPVTMLVSQLRRQVTALRSMCSVSFCTVSAWLVWFSVITMHGGNVQSSLTSNVCVW